MGEAYKITRSDHDFADIVCKVDRVMERKPLNEQGLIVEQIRVEP